MFVEEWLLLKNTPVFEDETAGINFKEQPVSTLKSSG